MKIHRNNNNLLKSDEVAKMLGITVTTLNNWRENALPEDRKPLYLPNGSANNTAIYLYDNSNISDLTEVKKLREEKNLRLEEIKEILRQRNEVSTIPVISEQKKTIDICNKDGQLVVSSREVANNFDKRHDHVIRDIETIIANMGSPQKWGHLFVPSKYKDSYGREQSEYLLTRDGFTLLAMGFTGKKALEWKLKYIEAFNKMEEQLKQMSTMLTEEQKLQLAIFQAKTVDEAAMASAELDRYRQKQLEEKQKELEYKDEVIKGATEDIDVYQKRHIINRVVRYKGADFQQRYNELYKTFEETHGIDLPARCHGYNLKQTMKKNQLSIIKYAERFGYIHDLYKVAVKLYETDVNEILKELQSLQ